MKVPKAFATERELADPKTPPNPQIEALMEVSHQLLGMSFQNEDGPQTEKTMVSYLYAEASHKLHEVLGLLFRVKNVLAGEDDANQLFEKEP